MDEDVTRRGLLRTAGALGVGLVAARAGLSAETTQPSGDWSQFGFDAANTHFNQYSSGPEGSVGVRWTYDGGDGVARSPAVVGGAVYASPGRQVVALDTDTGENLWTYEGDTFFTPPAVHNGRVYVGRTDGKILALDSDNGSVDWQVDTPQAIVAPGTIADETLYMGDVNQLYAIDPSSGDTQWELNIPGNLMQDPIVTTSAPAVGSSSIWVSSGPRVTVVFRDATTDKFQEGNWEDIVTNLTKIDDSRVAAQLDNLNLREHGPPVIDDERVYFGSDGLRAMTIESGERNWHEVTDIAIPTAPAFDGDTLYVGGGDNLPDVPESLAANAGTVHALNAADGTSSWTFGAAGPVNASPVATNSVLYVSTGAGVVHALNIFTGSEVWRQELGGELGVPVVTGGRMYVGSSRQGLVAIEERDPTPTPTPEPTATPTPEPTPEETATPTPDDSDSGSDTDTSGSGEETATPDSTESADGGGPGFGLTGGLAGLGGLAYLLRRQRDDE